VSEIEWEDGDGESPALPKEVPLKQELATITPKAMSALHSELLQDPHGIPLRARNWRRSEEEETDNDALVARKGPRGKWSGGFGFVAAVSVLSKSRGGGAAREHGGRRRAATSSSVMLSGPRREKELKFEYI
jgi:hypothetical protein